MSTVLVIHRDRGVADDLSAFFQREGHLVHVACTSDAGLTACSRQRPELALLEQALPGGWQEPLARLLAQDAVVVMVARESELAAVADALAGGADGVVVAPIEPERLAGAASRAFGAVKTLRHRRHLRHRAAWLQLGSSVAMRDLARAIEHAAAGAANTILLSGEHGTGKGRVATAIHALSARAPHPLVDLACARVDSGAVYGELFGRERTHDGELVSRSFGLAEIADGGTLVLDEVGALEPTLQQKLLRLLDTGTFRRAGSAADQLTDVRVIALTSRDLLPQVANGTFRADLYHRLTAVTLALLPLRARSADDLIELVGRIVGELHAEVPSAPLELTDGVMEHLAQHDWPGNVRQLRNVLERGMIAARGAQRLGLEHFGVAADERPVEATCRPCSLADVERQHIEHTLRAHHANRTRAARALGISRATLINKIKAYGLGEWRLDRPVDGETHGDADA